MDKTLVQLLLPDFFEKLLGNKKRFLNSVPQVEKSATFMTLLFLVILPTEKKNLKSIECRIYPEKYCPAEILVLIIYC